MYSSLNNNALNVKNKLIVNTPMNNFINKGIYGFLFKHIDKSICLFEMKLKYILQNERLSLNIASSNYMSS
jgi:hypothetical protein